MSAADDAVTWLGCLGLIVASLFVWALILGGLLLWMP
jgi:hypothetical protein